MISLDPPLDLSIHISALEMAAGNTTDDTIWNLHGLSAQTNRCVFGKTNR